jgi:ribosomal protein S24E
MYKVTSDLVFGFGFRTVFGGEKSTGFALICDTMNYAMKFVPKKVNVYLSSLMMKVPDHVYVLG